MAQICLEQTGDENLGLNPHLVNLVVAVEALKQETFQLQIASGDSVAEMSHRPVDSLQVFPCGYTEFFDVGGNGAADVANQ